MTHRTQTNTRRIASVLLLTLVAIGGCASTGFNGWENGRKMQSNLIFDRYAGSFAANEMAPRSDWPSIESGQRIREEITYTERFRDYQGQNSGFNNNFTRNFTTRRRGTIVR